ncbi:hypothetical protein BGX30_006980, partial [Mortierella sp. GBA39]
MPQEQKILFVGNTGSGKSYLLNYLGGTFVSDISNDGAGVTRTYETKDCSVFPNTTLVDTPGLIEETDERMKENAEQIIAALKTGGSFKVVLVMGDSSGRVDLYTTVLLKKLHDTLIDPSMKIGFIFNKTPQRSFDRIEGVAEGQITRYNRYIGNRITSHLVLKLADGDAAEAIALENAERLTAYIGNMEAHDLLPENVKEGGMTTTTEELEWWQCWWNEVKDFFASGRVVGAVVTALGAVTSIGQLM